MSEESKLAWEQFSKPIYSRLQARTMIDLAFILKNSNPNIENDTLIDSVLELTDMAIDAGKRASEAR